MRNNVEFRKNQSGQILLYTTIILMLAALILVPLMQFTFSSHRSAQIRQERTLELYASDSGIEDALYQIKTEKKGTELGNLGFGNTSSYSTGTPDMNDRTVDVGVQKLWIPQDLPGNSKTDAPVNNDTTPSLDTDKSDKLVVVGMLQTIQAAAATEDFDSGTWSGGTGWTGSWNHTGSASLASGGASGYSLKFADAAGIVTRQTNLPKYVESELKFDARASSFGPSDTASCQISTDGSSWTPVETWSQGNVTPDYNSFDINLHDLYGLGGGNTTVPLWVRFDANLHSSVVATHNFEPPNNTWTGGSGWASQWTRSSGSGNPTGDTYILSGNDGNGLPPQGSYYLRLRSNTGYAQRKLDLSGYADPHLQFWAKATSFEYSENAQFLTRVGNSGSFTTRLTWVNGGSGDLTDDNTYHLFDIDLGQLGAAGQSNFWIAFKANMGSTTDYFYVDDIKVVEGASFNVDNMWIGYQANSNTIEIAYTDSNLGSAYLDRVGVWMPPGCHYIGVAADQTTPELYKETPTTILPSTYADGTILEWDFASPGVALHQPPGQLPIVKTLTFTYEVDVAQSVEGMFTWIKAHGPSGQAYISWDKGYEVYKATSQAHSEILGTNTQVTAYVAQGEVNKKNASSYGDYVATGNPLLIDYAGSAYVKEKAIDPTNPATWVTKDGFLYDGRSDITSIPSDATVTAAWLYWSAFMNNSDWSSFGSQPDANVTFMYPKRYGAETFAVHAGDGDDSYTTSAWAGAQESMDFLAHTPVLTLSPFRYWGESPGWALNGNGNDTFFTAHKPVLASPSAKVRVAGALLTAGTDYVMNYITGNITIIKDTLSGQVTVDYSVSGSMTLTSGTDYTINQSVSGSDIRYTGFKVVNDNLEGTVFIDYYYAKHWETVQHAAYDQYGTALPPAQTQVPLSGPVGHTYACFADVTQLLTGNGAYTTSTGDGQYAVGNVKATPGEDGRAWDTRSFSGWSLIVLYQSPTETAHQFYLWDPIHNAADCPFMVQPNTDSPIEPPCIYDSPYVYAPFTLNDFYPPAGTVDGKATYFVGEGDTVYSGDSFGFKGASQSSYTYLSGTNNPVNDVMNTVSTTGEKGIDIDTYPVLDEVGSDTSANVQLRTQGDRWYLIYMILSFKTNMVPKADYAFNVASVTYQYELGAH